MSVTFFDGFTIVWLTKYPFHFCRPKAKDRRAVQAAIRAAKEENVKLRRLNNELHQELSQLTEDRVALEAQLQKLRPFHKLTSS